jgi:predicted 3-demethylubiquinone-9 3-methyltransferase (glyoxalase superfamily)
MPIAHEPKESAVPPIVPNLWFDTEAEDAAHFYVSVFPNSKITQVLRYGEAGMREAGMVMTVGFDLDGQPFTAINGGPQFEFGEAISFLVTCANQEEVDYYWGELSNGGEEGRCGWLKDRFGVSWQVVPDGLVALLTDSDPRRVERVTEVMLGMTKLDLETLSAAAESAP